MDFSTYPWSLHYKAKYQARWHQVPLSLWYDLTWNWTLVSWAIGEHSTKISLSEKCFWLSAEVMVCSIYYQKNYSTGWPLCGDVCHIENKKSSLFLLPLLLLITFLLHQVGLLALAFSCFFSSFFSSPPPSVCLSVYLTTWTNCPLQDLPKFTHYLATGFSIYWCQSLDIRAFSNIIPEPDKRPNWMRGWKRNGCSLPLPQVVCSWFNSRFLSDRKCTVWP